MQGFYMSIPMIPLVAAAIISIVTSKKEMSLEQQKKYLIINAILTTIGIVGLVLYMIFFANKIF